jgi:hypothetical protein
LKFKFYVRPANTEDSSTDFQHESVLLAEGLKDIGYKVVGNCDYWYVVEEQDFLIKKDNNSTQADVHIYNISYLDFCLSNYAELDQSVCNVLIDSIDGYHTISNSKQGFYFDLILRSHYNKNISYNNNVHPWAFGVSKRMVNENDKWISSSVEYGVFVNYRVFYNSRYIAQNEMNPLLEKKFDILNFVTDPLDGKVDKNLEREKNSYWWQTSFRHDPSYYKLLNSSQFTHCFGGGLILNSPILNNKALDYESVRRVSRKIALAANYFGIKKSKYFINYQFDSWRFWESMISNTVPLHMDFEDWGFVLPKMPRNGTHYIGVKGLNFKECSEFILDLPAEKISKISSEGRKWALDNYSSTGMAHQFIKLISHPSYNVEE